MCKFEVLYRCDLDNQIYVFTGESAPLAHIAQKIMYEARCECDGKLTIMTHVSAGLVKSCSMGCDNCGRREVLACGVLRGE